LCELTSRIGFFNKIDLRLHFFLHLFLHHGCAPVAIFVLLVLFFVAKTGADVVMLRLRSRKSGFWDAVLLRRRFSVERSSGVKRGAVQLYDDQDQLSPVIG
jgi:hypothetical protein